MKVIALTHMLEKEVTGSVYTLPKPKVRRMGETYDHKHAYSHQYFQKEVHQSVDATKTAETSGNGTSQAKVNTASNVKPGFSWAKVVKGNEIEETVIEEISEDTENQDKVCIQLMLLKTVVLPFFYSLDSRGQ